VHAMERLLGPLVAQIGVTVRDYRALEAGNRIPKRGVEQDLHAVRVAAVPGQIRIRIWIWYRDVIGRSLGASYRDGTGAQGDAPTPWRGYRARWRLARMSSRRRP
jgi:hypothetical protein